MRGFSNLENLCLFFILPFSCSKMNECSPSQLLFWIRTLSQCKLTSPTTCCFFFKFIFCCHSERLRQLLRSTLLLVFDCGLIVLLWEVCFLCLKCGFKHPMLFSSWVVIWLCTSHSRSYSFSKSCGVSKYCDYLKILAVISLQQRVDFFSRAEKLKCAANFYLGIMLLIDFSGVNMVS